MLALRATFAEFLRSSAKRVRLQPLQEGLHNVWTGREDCQVLVQHDRSREARGQTPQARRPRRVHHREPLYAAQLR